MFLKSQPCGERQADARGAWALGYQPRLPVDGRVPGQWGTLPPCHSSKPLYCRSVSPHFFPGSPELSGMPT